LQWDTGWCPGHRLLQSRGINEDGPVSVVIRIGMDILNDIAMKETFPKRIGSGTVEFQKIVLDMSAKLVFHKHDSVLVSLT
jgi:hypothetical protein